MSDIHEGDIGTVIRATIKDDGVIVDVSAATTKDFYFKKPDGTESGPHTMTFTTDGIDGQVEYATVSEDLDQAGQWDVQAHIIVGSTDNLSSVGHFEVKPNIAVSVIR